jgi:hypothetical protein
MANENRPASNQQAPDPASSYERAKPEMEAGQGRMENNKGVPDARPDRGQDAVTNRQDPTRQINAQDTPKQPDHSMHEEEPDGWDMAPTDIHDKRQQRHPRTEGRGGTP